MIKYSKDSRTIQPGDTYVAIRGERYDGHDFIQQAISKGAQGLVVERDIQHLAVPAGIDVRRVADSCEYLAKEAYNRVIKLEPEIVAVTGSVGKTTTKNAIATILTQIYPVVASKGNLNPPLGISLTILNDLVKTNRKTVL